MKWGSGTFMVILIALWAISCREKEDFALVLSDEQLCELNAIIPISIIYERLDVNPQNRLISCYHTPLSVTSSDTSTCIFPFQRQFNNREFGFYFLNVDEPRKKRLFGVQILSPVWSPDGQWLTWSNNQNIYRMPLSADSLDYSRVEQITRDSVLLLRPLWSPDSRKLLVKAEFTEKGKQFLNDGYYVINADGTDAQFVMERGDGAAWKNESEVLILDRTQIIQYTVDNGATSLFYSFPEEHQNIRSIKKSPWMPHLYFISRRTGSDYLSLSILNLNTKEIIQVVDRQIIDFAFLSAGELVLSLVQNQISVLYLFTVADGGLQLLYDYERL